MHSAPPSDDSLLARVARGDELAARRCIERYAPLVSTMARRFFGSGPDAEDATQDIFLELWRCAARFDATTASEAAFVVMIARRRLIDRARSLKRNRATVDIDELSIPSGDATADRYVEARAAARVLAELDEGPRKAVVLSVVHGMPHGEIAEALGMPLGSVKSHIRRTFLLLRRTLMGEETEAP